MIRWVMFGGLDFEPAKQLHGWKLETPTGQSQIKWKVVGYDSVEAGA